MSTTGIQGSRKFKLYRRCLPNKMLSCFTSQACKITRATIDRLSDHRHAPNQLHANNSNQVSVFFFLNFLVPRNLKRKVIEDENSLVFFKTTKRERNILLYKKRKKKEEEIETYWRIPVIRFHILHH